jgi:hypothetical protein
MSQQTTHVYFEWQCATLMYAYDVTEPLSRRDENAIAARKRTVEQEVYGIFLATVPEEVRNDPTRNLPPEAVMEMTRATLRRALVICGE